MRKHPTLLEGAGVRVTERFEIRNEGMYVNETYSMGPKPMPFFLPCDAFDSLASIRVHICLLVTGTLQLEQFSGCVASD